LDEKIQLALSYSNEYSDLKNAAYAVN